MNRLITSLALLTLVGCASQQKVATREPDPPAPAVAEETPAPPPVPAPVEEKPAPPQFTGVTIHFEFNESTLREDSRLELQKLAEIMRADEQLRIEIAGHADERGTTEYNLALGNRRADAARRYLESLGISPDRVTIISYGEERPAVHGQDEEAYAANRRDEIVPR